MTPQEQNELWKQAARLARITIQVPPHDSPDGFTTQQLGKQRELIARRLEGMPTPDSGAGEKE